MKYKVFSIFLLVLLTFAVLVPQSSGTDLFLQGDEVMHIATIRESMAKDQFLVPQLNGAPNYFKPPLLFWMGMVSESILGKSLLAVRMPSIILSSLTVVFLFLLLIEFRKKTQFALFVALLYLFTLGTFKFGRLLMMEQGMAFSFLATGYWLVLYLKRKKHIFMILAALTAGVSYLYKGPLFQVYTILFFMSWAGILLFHFKGQPLQWRGKKNLGYVVKILVYFHTIELIPIISWMAILTFNGNEGFLYYFFVVENFGKFFAKNQSALRILVGWLLYTFPIGLSLLYFAFRSYRSRIRSAESFWGRVFINTVLLNSLLHLIPNRKDMYYILPSLPLLFAGAALFSSEKLIQQNERIMRWNLKLNNLILFLAIVPILFLSNHLGYKLALLMVWLLVMGLYRLWKNISSGEIEKKRFLFAASIAIIMLSLQFLFLPALSRPILPDPYKKEIQGNLCIISSKPWDGYLIQNQLPEVQVRHTMPGNQNLDCLKSSRHVLQLNGPNNPEWQNFFSQQKTFPIWKRSESIQSLFSLQSSLTQQAKLFSR